MTEVVYSDSLGNAERSDGPPLRDCDALPAPLREALLSRFGLECRLTPIQQEAIAVGICTRNQHLIVSAPTNSGKTLVALFRVFSDLILKRGRCVYVAPLKALAEEKRVEFEALGRMIASNGGPKIRIAITTGDYQLTGDFLGSPPPENGELIICTPERMEILLRSKENISWGRGVSTYVLDEFHLLGDTHRGATVEILVTRILASCPWSRIVALSATMGGLDQVANWLGITGVPVKILESSWRYPILDRSVVSTADKEDYTIKMVAEILGEDNRSMLIFVNQKRDAEQLAKKLQKEFETNKKTISYLHAGLTLKSRSELQKDLMTARKRVLVTTTALKMGIDAPVTDVLVYDSFLWGQAGRKLLSYSDMLQMTGRAGRRDLPGKAVVLVSEDQAIPVGNLFKAGAVDPLRPQLSANQSRASNAYQPDPILSILLSEIAVQNRCNVKHLNQYVNHTFSCAMYGPVDCLRQVNELVRLKLAYRGEDDPDFIHPTKLGKTVSVSGLSPESGAIIASFLRALIKLDQKYEELKGRRFGYLRRLTDIDLIFLCCACYECRDAWLRVPSKQTVAGVQEFLESLQPDEKPIVNLWRDETSSDYPTRRLLTTLRVPFEDSKTGSAEKVFYRIMSTAILLYQHARGVPLASLAVKFKTTLGQIENNLKFSSLWILSCLSQICNGKYCYKFDFLMMRALKLIECITIGSELGDLLTIKGVGRNSVDKLIKGGFQSIHELESLSLPGLIDLGLKEQQAELIIKRVKKAHR